MNNPLRYDQHMSLSGLRVALFSGNYNCIRDGANQALNRLVGYLLREGASVRVYSPTVDQPAFAPTGDLVSVPSMPFPFGRKEYRFPLALSRAVRRDLAEFQPNILHVSSPDLVSDKAIYWARKAGIPVLASVHTRFETYFSYYRLGWVEPLAVNVLRSFYRRCDALLAPSESVAAVLREQGMNPDIGIWSRGVERDLFHPGRRDMAWRRNLGLGNDDVVIGFFSRVVMEKGLDVFSAALDALRAKGASFKVLIVGEGPARGWLESQLPQAVFTGFLAKEELARAVASMDVLFFPSVTETFGNVTLEAMASGVPVVASAATGSSSLIVDGHNGRLIAPGAVDQFASALQDYVADSALRAAHGAAGEKLSQNYSWDSINSVVADTYHRLIRGMCLMSPDPRTRSYAQPHELS